MTLKEQVHIYSSVLVKLSYKQIKYNYTEMKHCEDLSFKCSVCEAIFKVT